MKQVNKELVIAILVHRLGGRVEITLEDANPENLPGAGLITEETVDGGLILELGYEQPEGSIHDTDILPFPILPSDPGPLLGAVLAALGGSALEPGALDGSDCWNACPGCDCKKYRSEPEDQGLAPFNPKTN